MTRPILRHLRRSKTINVTQLVNNEDRHNEGMECLSKVLKKFQLALHSAQQSAFKCKDSLDRKRTNINTQVIDNMFRNQQLATHNPGQEKIVFTNVVLLPSVFI